MIEGIGIDLVRLDRVRKIYRDHSHSLSHFLTSKELRILARLRKKDLPALIFAFKEAVFKALDYHWINWKEIELVPGKGTSWRVKLYGTLQKWAQHRKIKQVMVRGAVGSSHAFAYAMALRGKS